MRCHGRRVPSPFAAAHATVLVAVLGTVLAAVLTGCGPRQPDTRVTSAAHAAPPTPLSAEFTAPSADAGPNATVPPLTGKLSRPDLLVISTEPLSAVLRDRISALNGIAAMLPLSVASVRVADRSITVAAAEPGTYRRFTPRPTAGMTGVWRAVAAGDVALSHQIAADLHQPLGGTLDIRQRVNGLQLRIGAFATTVPQIHAVVNKQRRTQLGMTRDNALLVSLHDDNIVAVSEAIRRVVMRRAQVQPLRHNATAAVMHAATLTGGAVADAVGAFSYRYFPDGTVQPQPDWVAANIRSEPVPILGIVTCHRVMLPQLRAALTEISRRGLATAIDPDDYGGCYVPRFIDRDPSKGLSLHTWGIAVDLNVATNQRGTSGEIDRDVVAIFKKWGFAWGGDWEWTDPMHFELAALIRG